MCKKKITGYHGTTRENAEIIVSSQHIIESDRNNDWLGRGVYFFAYKEHAFWWISHTRYTGQETRILSSDLEYNDEQILDLDDPKELETLDSLMKAAITASNLSDNPTAANLDTKQKRWCFACNLIKNLQPQIGIIVHTFRDSGKRVQYKYSEFYGSQRQICVSNPVIITNIQIV